MQRQSKHFPHNNCWPNQVIGNVQTHWTHQPANCCSVWRPQFGQRGRIRSVSMESLYSTNVNLHRPIASWNAFDSRRIFPLGHICRPSDTIWAWGFVVCPFGFVKCSTTSHGDLVTSCMFKCTYCMRINANVWNHAGSPIRRTSLL